MAQLPADRTDVHTNYSYRKAGIPKRGKKTNKNMLLVGFRIKMGKDLLPIVITLPSCHICVHRVVRGVHLSPGFS